MNSAQSVDEPKSEIHWVSNGEEPVQRSLSRSPHPYHRRGASLLGSETPESSLKHRRNKVSTHTSQSTSESGTEADDERGASLLRGLPAPPLRARKGLRGSTPVDRTPAVSPLPTPPIQNVNTGAFPFQKATGRGRAVRARDVKGPKTLEEYAKRKRAEIIRRAVEIVLLFLIAVAASRPDDTWTKLKPWLPELWCHNFLTLSLYFLHPFRRSHSAWQRGHPVFQSLKLGFHVPSRFDPGPLLYPVLLPLIVSISLLRRTSTFLLPNLILGLASLPETVIPWSDAGQPFSKPQWAVTLLPLIISQNLATKGWHHTPFALKTSGDAALTAETLTLLYPLHCVTRQTIYFLTTTSLDPAEIQLLSAALTNVYLFSATPQAEILKALTWLGGIAMFVTCRQVLGWEVALARIPSWRFRRELPQSRSRASIASRVDAALCYRLSMLGARGKNHDLSDSEDEPKVRIRAGRSPGTPKLKLDLRKVTTKALNTVRAASAVESHANGDTWPAERNISDSYVKYQRRHTITSGNTNKPSIRTTSSGRPRRTLSPNSSNLVSLTLAQAWVRKWLYAIYVYLATCAIILGPIRRYVSARALTFHEPFGWALGYLFGSIPQFRFWVVLNNLERWISLPARGTSVSTDHSGWVEYLRQDVLGAANTRLALCGYCLGVLTVGIVTVLRLSSVVEVDTRRKVFHGIMVAMFLPTIFVDPCFTALALTLILAIFLLLDLFRASQLPPISKPLTLFLAPYVDGRDHRGPVIVSHVFLLIGCAIPLWLSLAGAPRSGTPPWDGWDIEVRDVSMVSGVICVGMGDAAASLIGRRIGRHKWLWSGGKSLEGSLAFVAAVAIGLIFAHTWLLVGGWRTSGTKSWVGVVAKSVIAATGASLTEAVLTSCNDNVVVPVTLWLLVRALEI